MAAVSASLPSSLYGAGSEPQVDPQVFVGSKISIISNSNIRYEGTLYAYNEINSTISLQHVRSFGSEDRLPSDKAVAASKELFEYIIFRVTDIKDLEVSEPPKLDLQRPRTRNFSNSISSDPAIVKSCIAPSVSPGLQGMGMMQNGGGMGNGGPAWRFAQAPTSQSGGGGQPGTGNRQQQGGRGRRGRMRRGRGWGGRGLSNQGMMMNVGGGAGLGTGAGLRPGMINPAQHVKLLKEYQNVVPPVAGSVIEPQDQNLDLESFSTMAQQFEKMDKTGQAGLSSGNLLAGSNAESSAAGTATGNTAVPAPELDPKKYYNPDDNFFDKISCEALDPNQGVQPRNWRRENQLNNNTFGRPPRFNAGNNWNSAGGNWNGGGRGSGGGFGYGGQGRGGNRRGGGRGGRAGVRSANRGQWNNQQQGQWNDQQGQWNNQPGQWNNQPGQWNNQSGQRRQSGWGGSANWNQGRNNSWNDGNTGCQRQSMQQRGGWNQSGGPGTMNNWTHGPVPQQMQIQAQSVQAGGQQPPVRGRGRRGGGGMSGGRQWVGSVLPPAAKEVLQQHQFAQQNGVHPGLSEPGGEQPTDSKPATIQWTFPVDVGSAAAAELQTTRDAAGSSNKENSDYDIINTNSPDQAER